MSKRTMSPAEYSRVRREQPRRLSGKAQLHKRARYSHVRREKPRRLLGKAQQYARVRRKNPRRLRGKAQLQKRARPQRLVLGSRPRHQWLLRLRLCRTTQSWSPRLLHLKRSPVDESTNQSTRRTQVSWSTTERARSIPIRATPSTKTKDHRVSAPAHARR